MFQCQEQRSAMEVEDTAISEMTADFTVTLESHIDVEEDEEMKLDFTRQEQAAYVRAAAVMALPVFLL